jgi:hypothetical protein
VGEKKRRRQIRDLRRLQLVTPLDPDRKGSGPAHVFITLASACLCLLSNLRNREKSKQGIEREGKTGRRKEKKGGNLT